MKTITEIKWKQPVHNCKCVVCNAGQAEFVAHIVGFELPVCLSCSYLDETELMKAIKGGQNG